MLNNLMKRFTARGENKSWGSSPTPSADELPEWTREFQSSDWTSTPNPRASKSRQQRRARLLMRLMLASLPLSLISCLVAMTGRSSSDPVVQEDDTQDLQALFSRAHDQAQIVAEKWLAEGGVLPLSMIWQGFKPSHLTCEPQLEPLPADENEADGGVPAALGDPALGDPAALVRCEEHLFRAHIERRGRERYGSEWVQVTVTINPLTGTAAGVHMLLEESQLTQDKPLWDKQPNRTKADLGFSDDYLGAAIEEWASAWTAGWAPEQQKTLYELAGVEVGDIGNLNRLGEKPWFGLPGWEVIPGSVERLSQMVIAEGSESYLVTVGFDIAQRCTTHTEDPVDVVDYDSPRCLDECPEPEQDHRSFRDGGLEVCGSSLAMTADLHISIEEDTVKVVEYGAVGTLDPEQIAQPQTDQPQTDQ